VVDKNRFLRCLRCRRSNWQQRTDLLRCGCCNASLPIEEGVIFLQGGYRDEATAYYDYTGGPHFVEVTFAANPQIYCTSRQYKGALDCWFPSASGALLDLGCGDGRLSLWALEKGFSPVVALDSTAASLKRLVADAKRRKLDDRLVAICATAQDDCVVPNSFDVILFVELLMYLLPTQPHGEILARVHSMLAESGRLVLAEFCRSGKLLADVVAMNMENMRLIAGEGVRLEKFGDRALRTVCPEPAELMAECERAGFAILDRRGLSPIPMLFQHAYNFTSYPLRPKLDDSMQKLIEKLDDMTSVVSPLARNIIMLMKKA
jgi:2-polyprenyl-3-methyl-5-hydroxy-6-metoxy-1,4-benzoquinol methylase